MRSRLHALCPYFAMFPHTFAHDRVLAHTAPGEVVLDPFSGRGTTLLESLLLDRQAVAIDINPVAACVTNAKAKVPSLGHVEKRLGDLENEYKTTDKRELEEERRTLPIFFRHAFYYTTLREVLFLRRHLDWKHNDMDCFLSALVLGSLHGEMDRSPSYFSNQMPRTISTKPEYSVRYWREHGLRPKQKHTFAILRDRARLRLSQGKPSHRGFSVLADARLASSLLPTYTGRVKAVVTSPPYLDVTSYEEDQWLRLWFLGGEPRPTYGRVSKDDRHTSARAYWLFLAEVWRGIAPLVGPDATVVCRIGGKRLDLDSIGHNLVATLRSALPNAALIGDPQVSSPRQRQTDNFRPGTVGCAFEADFTFQVR